jgi:hypothetical protein
VDEFVQAELVGEPVEATLAEPAPAAGSAIPSSRIARAGKLLVVGPDAEFPDRCILCNKPADDFRRKQTFYWHNPLYFFLILPGLLVYAIVALMVRRKIDVLIPVCPDHRRRRRNLIIVAWSCFAAAIGCFVLAGILNNGWPALGGVLLIITAAVVGVIAARSLTVTKIDKDGSGIFKGACAAFLDNLKEAGYRLDGSRVPPPS